MNERTRLALNAINRDFYRQYAQAFSATRVLPWPGWRRVLDQARMLISADQSLSVLDVGCGNGRFALHLARYLSQTFRYVGLDSSHELLVQARQALSLLSSAVLVEHDLVAPEECVLPVEAGHHHDLVVLFGLLHHVPAAARRRAVVAACTERLRPSGLLVISFWQYARRGRFQKKIVPWQWAAHRYGVDPHDLEGTDQLLRWGHDPEAVRYCHFISEEEAADLLNLPQLENVETFQADGDTGDLNHYVVMRRVTEDQ